MPGRARALEPAGVGAVRDDDARSARCRRPSAIASMSACRLLPRPEIRTPIAGVRSSRSSTDDAFAAGAGSRRCAPRRARRPRPARRAARRSSVRRARDDQPDAHVERPQHVGVRHLPVCCSHWKIGRHLPRRSIDRARACRRQDARQVVGDAAAGDVRHALDQARLPAAAGSTGRYERCGDEQRLADRSPELRDTCVRARARPTRTRSAAPASSRWCAGPTTAGRSARRPARSSCRRSAASRGTTPTMKPATSYSPSA